LYLEAVPYGFRPFPVYCDRKELLAVIEHKVARRKIALDMIARRRRIIRRGGFLDFLGLRKSLEERGRFPQ